MEMVVEMVRSSMERGAAMDAPDFEVALERPGANSQIDELGASFFREVNAADRTGPTTIIAASPPGVRGPEGVEAALKRVSAAIDYADFAATHRAAQADIPGLSALGHAAREKLTALQIGYGKARDSIRSSFDGFAKQIAQPDAQQTELGLEGPTSADPLTALREALDFQRESNRQSQQKYMEMMRVSFDLNEMQLRTTFVTTIAGKSLKNHDMLLRGQ